MGMTIRIDMNQVSSLGRNTQGVRLINLKDDQKVATVSVIDKKEETEVSEEAEMSKDNNEVETNN